MQNNKFCEDIDYHSEQICYTSEERYEECFYNVERYIAARYGNPSFQAVDIAQGDNVNFCLCDECMEVFVEEGSTHAGAVVRHANRLSEEMNELYPGIAFQIFAYAGTNKAPAITVPNEYVYVTFCYDMNCSNHKVDGSECEGVIKFNKRNNVMYDEWIKGWCDITPNVWIWFYTLGSTLQQYTVIDNIYADFRYFKEIGARGIFLESENYGDIRIKRVEHILMREMNWNSEMTSEECESVICSILEREYGDGWQYIREYINEWVTAQDLVGCWHCWAGLYADNRYQKGFFKDRFDSFVEMLDEAGRLANTKAQENAVKRLTITMLHMGCYSSYYFAYLEGDTERMELLSDRYDRCLNLLRELGYDPNKFYGLSYGSYKSFASTIEEAAWKEWVNGVIGFTGITGRPLPEDAPVITE